MKRLSKFMRRRKCVISQRSSTFGLAGDQSALLNAEAAVAHQEMIVTICVGHRGLGFGRESAGEDDPRQENRKKVCAQMEQDAEVVRFAEEADHIVQGRWQRWEELMITDFSWHRTIYTLSPDALRFLLNSTMDTCPSPANLERWKQTPVGRVACVMTAMETSIMS